MRVEGQPQRGSWLKVKNVTIKERSEMPESPYVGEDRDDLDYILHGYDVSFEVDVQDGSTLDFMQAAAARQDDVQRPQNVTMTFLLAFRERGAQNKAIVLRNGFLRVDEVGFSGRKENVTTKFEGKFKNAEFIAA